MYLSMKIGWSLSTKRRASLAFWKHPWPSFSFLPAHLLGLPKRLRALCLQLKREDQASTDGHSDNCVSATRTCFWAESFYCILQWKQTYATKNNRRVSLWDCGNRLWKSFSLAEPKQWRTNGTFNNIIINHSFIFQVMILRFFSNSTFTEIHTDCQWQTGFSEGHDTQPLQFLLCNCICSFTTKTCCSTHSWLTIGSY